MLRLSATPYPGRVARQVGCRFDIHIYVLIAGTYTPFIMEVKESLLAIALLVGVWCAAIAGIVIKLKFPGRFDRLSVGLYLAMGWSGMMLYDSVVKALPAMAMGFIVAGGVLYTLGVVCHAWQGLCCQNAIWQGFVLGGAACHYAAVLDIVLK
jgi:hemolysin III